MQNSSSTSRVNGSDSPANIKPQINTHMQARTSSYVEFQIQNVFLLLSPIMILASKCYSINTCALSVFAFMCARPCMFRYKNRKRQHRTRFANILFFFAVIL